MADSHVSSVWERAWIRPSEDVKVTSNNLLFFNDNKSRDGCSVSRAQAVRALSPGCLPWILPMSVTLAFSAQLDRSVKSRSSGTATTTFGVGTCSLDPSMLGVGWGLRLYRNRVLVILLLA